MSFEYKSLKDFVEYDDSDEALKDIDPEIIKMRQTKNFYRLMLDVWGEMSGCMEAYKKYRKRKMSREDYLIQLNAFHRMCCTVYTSASVTPGAKWELKVAEWELYDFMLWNNEFHNNINSVTEWFDQWCFGINKEMLG